MPTVHPAFDPKTKTWFIDQFEAPTLAALKRLLPRRTKIKGYWPDGYMAVRPATEIPTRPLARESFNLIRSVSPKPTPAIKPPRYAVPKKAKPIIHDREAILSLWVTGLSGPEIGARLGLPCKTTAGAIVAVCRKLGDPRALSRSTNGSKIAAAYARKRTIVK